MNRNVLGKIDEERLPDYGNSKGYALLPNFCPETDAIEVVKNSTGLSKNAFEAKEKKDKVKREKDSKIEYIMLNKILANNRID